MNTYSRFFFFFKRFLTTYKDGIETAPIPTIINKPKVGNCCCSTLK
ncbi:MAG: hypothetical protein HWN79_14155 [Candidatus Lokiarchaeota archaeon]|nr:hypothetical protein [Candidatus Lokiarchaeota archaeon]